MSNGAPAALRKAAILIDSLDPPTADALLGQVDAQYAARVRQAVMSLGPVQAEERDRVIREFLRGRASLRTTDNGIELDDALAAKLSRSFGPSDRPATPPAVVEDATPFRFLHEAAGDTLATFLRHEHPQTVAVVVSHLPPERAADLLLRLPDDLQSNVLRRVAQLDEADPEIIREVERELQLLLSDQLRTIERRSAGLAAVQAILSAADADDREKMLANLAHRDRQLASQIALPPPPRSTRTGIENPQVGSPEKPLARPPTDSDGPTAARPPQTPDPVPKTSAPSPKEPTGPQPDGPDRTAPQPISLQFDDLALLDDQSIAMVLQAATPAVTLLALTGARREFVDRILRQLPAREAKALRKKIQQSGPLRLRDVDQAQRHLAHLAGQLVAEGKIPAPPSRRFATAA